MQNIGLKSVGGRAVVSKSIYYGAQGNTVKDVQKQLNEAGMNLKVDGVWGDKTETALAQVTDFLKSAKSGTLSVTNIAPAPANSTGSLSVTNIAPSASRTGASAASGSQSPASASSLSTYSSAPQYESAARMAVPELKTDEEYRKIAESKLNPSFESELASLLAKVENEGKRKQQGIAALDPFYTSKMKEVDDAYEVSRQGLSDQAMKRGFGRSSYVTDQMERSYGQQTQTNQALAVERDSRRTALQDDIDTLYKQLDDDVGRLTRARADRILETIDSLRKEDQALANDALKYNNSLLASEQSREEARYLNALNAANQLNRDVTLAQQQRISDAAKAEQQLKRDELLAAQQNERDAAQAARQAERDAVLAQQKLEELRRQAENTKLSDAAKAEAQRLLEQQKAEAALALENQRSANRMAEDTHRAAIAAEEAARKAEEKAAEEARKAEQRAAEEEAARRLAAASSSSSSSSSSRSSSRSSSSKPTSSSSSSSPTTQAASTSSSSTPSSSGRGSRTQSASSANEIIISNKMIEYTKMGRAAAIKSLMNDKALAEKLGSDFYILVRLVNALKA